MILCGVVLLVNTALGAPLSQTESDRAHFVMSGHISSREQLRQGAFIARGQYSIRARDAQAQVHVDVTIESVFDLDAKRIRFDRHQPFTGPTAPRDHNGRPVDRGGKFAQTPNHSLYMPNGDRLAVSVLDPKVIPTGINPFDVRTLGCINFHEVEAGLVFDDVFLNEKAFLTEGRVTSISQVAPKIVRLGWLLGDSSDALRTIWFDEDRGFSPIRMEDRYRIGDSASQAGGGKKGEWSEPVSICEVGWSEIEGVWVPASFTCEYFGGVWRKPFKPVSENAYHFAFEWGSVNRPVDERVFEVEGMEDGKELVVIDSRLGKPIITKNPYAGKIATTDPHSSRPGLWWRFLLAANVVLIVAILGFYWRRRRGLSRRAN